MRVPPMEVNRFKHRQLAPTVGRSSRSPANSKDLKINLVVAGTAWLLHFDINSTSWFRSTRLQLPTPSRTQIKSCSYCCHGDRGRIKFLSALESKLLRYCISTSMRVHVCGLWPPIILHEHELKTRQNIGLLPRWCGSKFNLLYTAIRTPELTSKLLRHSKIIAWHTRKMYASTTTSTSGYTNSCMTTSTTYLD
jgi:hypothetical protein